LPVVARDACFWWQLCQKCAEFLEGGAVVLSEASSREPMSTQRAVTPVEFHVRDGDPAPELVLHALAGVCSALDSEEFGSGMTQADRNRVAGLTVAAGLLSAWLTARL
jgi:hypothetical protein